MMKFVMEKLAHIFLLFLSFVDNGYCGCPGNNNPTKVIKMCTAGTLKGPEVYIDTSEARRTVNIRSTVCHCTATFKDVSFYSLYMAGPPGTCGSLFKFENPSDHSSKSSQEECSFEMHRTIKVGTEMIVNITLDKLHQPFEADFCARMKPGFQNGQNDKEQMQDTGPLIEVECFESQHFSTTTTTTSTTTTRTNKTHTKTKPTTTTKPTTPTTKATTTPPLTSTNDIRTAEQTNEIKPTRKVMNEITENRSNKDVSTGSKPTVTPKSSLLTNPSMSESSSEPTNRDLLNVLNAVIGRLETVEKKLRAIESLEKRMASFEVDIKKLWVALDDRVKKVDARVKRLKDKVEGADMHAAVLTERMQNLEKERDTLRDDVSYLQSQSMSIATKPGLCLNVLLLSMFL
ncbi:integumentary mucin C.1-like isoform X2 [Mya arenaria]|uniref:integumentary mucin C.1-like isoform X2 n=1 Tax=Mya arenaria TaxID=6604 RepID=UPI0022E0212D|nr:integumentary mucin C.1-like isoform X2 [Mya arenaria]XP_052791757.1 integumentary mucin C.1-like isoform X2 [Mya arenaria]